MRMVQKLISTIIYVVWDMAAVTTAVVIGLGLRFGLSNAALKANLYVARA